MGDLDDHDVNVGGPGAKSGMTQASNADIVDLARFESGQKHSSLDLGELPLHGPGRLVVGIAMAGLDDVSRRSRNLAQDKT